MENRNIMEEKVILICDISDQTHVADAALFKTLITALDLISLSISLVCINLQIIKI